MPKPNKNQKIINQIGFIESQMNDLADKLEEIELFANVDHLGGLLNAYDDFTIREITKKQGAAN